MHHHARPYVRAVDAERVGRGRDQPTEPHELDRLLARVAARDGQAWTTLVDRFTPALRRTVRAHRLSDQDTDDILQATWIQLLLHADDIRDSSRLGAWLHTTARRLSLRRLRVPKLEPLEDERGTLLHERCVPCEAQARVEDGECAAALADALRTLPERHRRMMEMLLGDRTATYAEIADTLDMPVGSIGPTYARCVKRLRRNRRLSVLIGADGAD